MRIRLPNIVGSSGGKIKKQINSQFLISSLGSTERLAQRSWLSKNSLKCRATSAPVSFKKRVFLDRLVWMITRYAKVARSRALRLRLTHTAQRRKKSNCTRTMFQSRKTSVIRKSLASNSSSLLRSTKPRRPSIRTSCTNWNCGTVPPTRRWKTSTKLKSTIFGRKRTKLSKNRSLRKSGDRKASRFRCKMCVPKYKNCRKCLRKSVCTSACSRNENWWSLQSTFRRFRSSSAFNTTWMRPHAISCSRKNRNLRMLKSWLWTYSTWMRAMSWKMRNWTGWLRKIISRLWSKSRSTKCYRLKSRQRSSSTTLLRLFASGSGKCARDRTLTIRKAQRSSSENYSSRHAFKNRCCNKLRKATVQTY